MRENTYNNDNYLLLKADSEVSIIKDIEQQQNYLFDSQKAFLKNISFNDISYTIKLDYQKYYNQVLSIKTKTEKIIKIKLSLYYDKAKDKIFVNEDNEELLEKIDTAIENYNEEYNKLKKHLEYFKDNYNIEYKEDTIIKLINKFYDARYIIKILNSYYDNSIEYDYILDLETLITILKML